MIKGLVAYDEVATTVVTEQALTEIKAPDWARVLLGAKVQIVNVTPTADEGVVAKMRIASDDVGILPCNLLPCPQSGTEAADAAVIAPKPEYYAINAPLSGGETFKPYVTVEVSSTGVIVAQAELIFGQEGDILPSSVDPLPGIQRFHEIGTYTATEDDLATGTAFSIVGADAIRRLRGIRVTHASDSEKQGAGFFRWTSDGFAASPIEVTEFGVGSYLAGTTGGALGPIEVTSEYQNMPVTPVCTITDYYYQLGGVAITTDYWQTGVEFSRKPAWY